MDMFSQIQKMQADMQAAQDALANTLVDATVGRRRREGDGHRRRRAARDQDRPERRRSRRRRDARRPRGRGRHEAMLEAKKLQAEQLGAATGGLDVDSLMGGLGGLLGPGPEPT